MECLGKSLNLPMNLFQNIQPATDDYKEAINHSVWNTVGPSRIFSLLGNNHHSFSIIKHLLGPRHEQSLLISVVLNMPALDQQHHITQEPIRNAHSWSQAY